VLILYCAVAADDQPSAIASKAMTGRDFMLPPYAYGGFLIGARPAPGSTPRTCVVEFFPAGAWRE
jgi:hypothetical protein